MRALIAVLVSLLLFACTARTEELDCGGRYYFHASYPEAYRAPTAGALATWSEFSGRTAEIVGETDDSSCAFRVVSDTSEEYATRRAQIATDYLGMHDKREGSIAVVPEQIEAWCRPEEGVGACVRFVVLHELGHANGLGHTKEPGVMHGAAEDLHEHYTDSDLEECRRVGACD
jgi:hypothetical protein